MSIIERTLSVEHLSGLKNGTAEVFHVTRIFEIFIGGGRGSGINFGGEYYPQVRPHHATLRIEEHVRYALCTIASFEESPLFLNEKKISTVEPVEIKSGDTVQFGVDGPKIRIEIDPPSHIPLAKSKSRSTFSLRESALFIKDLLLTQINTTVLLLLLAIGATILLLFAFSDEYEDALFTSAPEIKELQGKNFNFDWTKAVTPKTDAVPQESKGGIRAYLESLFSDSLGSAGQSSTYDRYKESAVTGAASTEKILKREVPTSDSFDHVSAYEAVQREMEKALGETSVDSGSDDSNALMPLPKESPGDTQVLDTFEERIMQSLEEARKKENDESPAGSFESDSPREMTRDSVSK